jgi:crotonobetainyl-CoA:carnitine CoA-transferase CaiB-like acyl-CoA transferase
MPAYDHVVQAFSGMAAVQAPKGGQPTLVRHGIIDKTTGLVAAEVILAALVARGRTGTGSHVEISMLDVALSLMWPDGMMNHTCLDPVDELPSIAGSFRLTPTADGFVSLVTVNGRPVESAC